MQHKKQAAIKRTCKGCGSTLLGKYAAKNHICRPVRAAPSRQEALDQQRKV